ncbi:1,25-dihydroxyvitamin D(3) 24-hydroxylase, mitochondrial-like [Gigantopelta aegis]|uniref:1,25-dihydroxyvitamin D(3) 24-hydroxylase, mitochondrial-like n=1 Tax=Gigantopelta aegis TaxID=1735272 RepID=UPI001B8895E0|nr:1,25-dihydroxyvitamin D(3) 24-hydroxylase, mitochondrial-like [Gigantopelta aegis]
MQVWSEMARTLRTANRFLPEICQYGCLQSQRRQSASTTVEHAPDTVKPLSEMPEIKLSVFDIAKILVKDEMKHNHEQQLQIAHEYGPIYRQKFGNSFDAVFVMDAMAAEQLVRQLGQETSRLNVPQWEEYRTLRGEDAGILLSQDEEWRRIRRVMDKPMLRMTHMERYTQELNPVMKDFVDHIAAARRDDGSVDNLNHNFFNWALESIALLLYRRRFGCIDGSSDALSKKFTESVSTMFELNMKMFGLPPKFIRIFFPLMWKKFVDCWDTFFIMGRRCVEETKTLQDEGILSSILAQNQLTEMQVVSSLTETMMAAVDTTSNTVLWILYELARHRDIQEKLLKELNDVIPPGQQPTYEHIKQTHYLKAIVRESLRIHPAVISINRRLSHDTVILGYQVPAGMHVMLFGYGMSLSGEVFDNPKEFRPERWLRQNRTSSLASFASMPFGIGARGCLGRRVAELEMYLVLSQLIRRFDVVLTDPEPLKGLSRILVVPEKQIPVIFKDRSSSI